VRQNEFNFIACSNYFLSPAKVDLLPTDGGHPSAPTPPGYGHENMMNVALLT